MNWYIEVMKKYSVFSGRARRSEYWFFVLINILISIILGFVATMTGIMGAGMHLGILSGLYSLAMIIPSLAVSVRRLHDTNRSGWWLLICLVPLIGLIILLVFMLLDSTPGENQYGPNPKAATA